MTKQIIEKEEIDKKENAPERNYYLQSTLISLFLFIIFIIVLVSLGIYKQDGVTIGTLFFVFLVRVINIFLKKFAEKYGADLLK